MAVQKYSTLTPFLKIFETPYVWNLEITKWNENGRDAFKRTKVLRKVFEIKTGLTTYLPPETPQLSKKKIFHYRPVNMSVSDDFLLGNATDYVVGQTDLWSFETR